MKTEAHLKNLKESFEVIEESIEKGLAERQRTIGFSASAACADMLEILLHKNNLIDPGFIIKHEWLKSKNKTEEKFPFDFPKKKELLKIIFCIEEKRNILCYGKPQPTRVIRKIVDDVKNRQSETGGMWRFLSMLRIFQHHQRYAYHQS